MIKAFLGYFQRMRIPTKQEIREYYPKYLLVHRNPINKLLHIFGNALTVAFLIAVIASAIKLTPFVLPLLFLTPFIVYLGAWPGHRLFEKNKPATWNQNPLLTKSCDWIMMKDLFTKRIPLDTRPFWMKGITQEQVEKFNPPDNDVVPLNSQQQKVYDNLVGKFR